MPDVAKPLELLQLTMGIFYGRSSTFTFCAGGIESSPVFETTLNGDTLRLQGAIVDKIVSITKLNGVNLRRRGRYPLEPFLRETLGRISV